MKKYFNKEFGITEEDNEDFKNSIKCWICDNGFIDNDVKVRDHCHITEKYRRSTHRDCNINLKLNKKSSAVFCNIKFYDSHLIMRELCKLNLKRNVVTNGLENYMSFAINNTLGFIGSFQFLSFSLESLVKNLSKDGFQSLIQEIDNNVLDLPNWEEELPSKKKFYSP